MLKYPSSAFLAAGLFSLSIVTAGSALADDETRQSWRLFVSDQVEPSVTVIDAAEGKTIGKFATTGYVTHLVPSDSGKTLFAVQMDHDVVNVIKSGIELSGHGDHSDIAIGDPALLPMKLEGARPVHAVMHGDEILQFFDREGEARAFSEKKLLEGSADYKMIKAAAAHHGVAVPMGSHVLISEPNLGAEVKEGELPPRLGLKVLDESGQQVGDIATCTGLHGEAFSAGLVTFGCDEGVIVAQPDGRKPPKVEMLAYGDGLPEGRVSTIVGGKAMQFFLGNYGADKLVLIDPSSNSPFRLVNLPVRHVHFVLDPVRVKIAYVFTEDGRLHALDVLSGEIVLSEQITEPYSKDGHWRDPRPRIAVMDNIIAITDPNKQLIRLIDAKSFKAIREIQVEGLPFNIAAIGGSGLQH